MRFNRSTVTALSALALAAVVASLALAADPLKDAMSGAASQPMMQLPPGWTAADMQACVASATPGKMHEFLAKSVGTWQCKNTMTMFPGAPEMKFDSTSVVTSIMDGRYVQADITGEMPGMGKFTGRGIYGYDNAAQKFVCSWVDSQTTAVMPGTGELSADQKTMTWTTYYTCPITKKLTPWKQVEHYNTPTSTTIDMYTIDPKTGKEFKVMVIELTKKS